jgi:hypothetical protein
MNYFASSRKRRRCPQSSCMSVFLSVTLCSLTAKIFLHQNYVRISLSSSLMMCSDHPCLLDIIFLSTLGDTCKPRNLRFVWLTLNRCFKPLVFYSCYKFFESGTPTLHESENCWHFHMSLGQPSKCSWASFCIPSISTLWERLHKEALQGRVLEAFPPLAQASRCANDISKPLKHVILFMVYRAGLVGR